MNNNSEKIDRNINIKNKADINVNEEAYRIKDLGNTYFMNSCLQCFFH